MIRDAADADAADALARAAARHDVRCWTAPLASPGTGLLDPASMAAMEAADAVLAWVTPAAVAGQTVEQDLIVAAQLAKSVLALPTFDGDRGRLAPFLGRARWLPMFVSAEASAAEVARRMPRRPFPGPPAPPPAAAPTVVAVPIRSEARGSGAAGIGYFLGGVVLAGLLVAVLWLALRGRTPASPPAAARPAVVASPGNAGVTARPPVPVPRAAVPVGPRTSGPTFPTSFNCAAARTRVEIATCHDPQLAALERRMAQAYWSLHAALDADEAEALRVSQRSWFQTLTACGDAADVNGCTARTLQERINDFAVWNEGEE